ncbi:MAG: riboflavin biosynthesis protein RibF [Fastidiosipila sp.]|nr:riboflavin biosynthesis protein RibF [Fastidiosipila sp.]
MKIYKSLEKLNSDQKRGIALGVFDGMHLGHRRILQELLDVCREKFLRSAVFTFVSPYGAQENMCLLDIEDKYKALEEIGIDDVFVAEMSEEFRKISADEFLKNILEKQLGVKAIVVGEDARFGAGAEGDIAFLSDYAASNDITYKVVDDVLYQDERISSSRIRNCLSLGKMDAVTAMLTQPYKLRGVVVRGREIGSRKGFPTANFLYPAKRARLRDGVYATVACCSAGRFCAISNIGVSPTIEEETPMRVETYLYDFDGSLYGEEIEVEFLAFVRPELRFDSVDELTEAVQQDLENVRQWHQAHVVK